MNSDAKARFAAMRRDGVTGSQIVRRVLEMIGILHQRGHESLYIDPGMSPSGGYWRYHIGAMIDGQWPTMHCDEPDRVPRPVRGSIGGGYDQELPWGTPTDSAQVFAEGFEKTFPEILESAAVANPEYAAWYREMLQKTEPEGVLIFLSDYGPNHEYAHCWGEPRDFRMPMPPGYNDGIRK